MTRSPTAPLALFLLLASPSLALADFSAHPPRPSRLTLLALNDDAGGGCTKDTDCKGSRVCTKGKCEEGSSAPSAAGAMQAPAPTGFPGGQSASSYRLLEINQRLRLLADTAPGYGLAVTGIVLGSLFTAGGVVVLLFVSILIGVTVAVCGLLLLTLGIVGAVSSSSESTRREREIRDLENERMLLMQRSSIPAPQGIPIASF